VRGSYHHCGLLAIALSVCNAESPAGSLAPDAGAAPADAGQEYLDSMLLPPLLIPADLMNPG